MDLPPILYEDESLLAINKPAGLLSIRDGYNPDLPHAASLLAPRYGRLWIVHRLDRQTSGVLLLARSAEAHRALNRQFEQRQTHKLYHALVSPCPAWAGQTCELPLQVDADRRHRTLARPGGKPARTDFRLLEPFPAAALLEAAPHTGYTHQIRAHLLALGFPLLGDALYRPPSASTASLSPIARPALHAFQLEIIHLQSGAPLRLQAPYPPDFTNAIQSLRQS
jgi:tRNA pseudouridine32 synthase / 23S rRNA pseudouridine746 synthase